MNAQSLKKSRYALFLGLYFSLLLGVSGCATQEWVQGQIAPIQSQVTEVETRLDETEIKTDYVAEQTELALKNLENLRLEKLFVLGVQEGANFTVDSASLSAEAQRAIKEFVRSWEAPNDIVFLVAGHTDSRGPDAYNFALGQRRAASVARYLISHTGIDPVLVTVVSYGEHAPIADNATRQGRYRNRRVEIQLYKEAVTSTPGNARLQLERVQRGR